MINEPSALTQKVEKMESAVGRGDWNAARDFFTPDVQYRVGHRAPVTGVDGIRNYMDWQAQRVRWDGHTIHMMFSRDDTAIFEVTSHFTRLADGASLDVPCTDIYRFNGNKIADWRVYSDTSAFGA